VEEGRPGVEERRPRLAQVARRVAARAGAERVLDVADVVEDGLDVDVGVAEDLRGARVRGRKRKRNAGSPRVAVGAAVVDGVGELGRAHDAAERGRACARVSRAATEERKEKRRGHR